MKHTPGPWFWDGNVCDYDKEQEAPWLLSSGVADNLTQSTQVLTGEIECKNGANARLIAKAPEMYDMLRVLRGSLSANQESWVGALLKEVDGEN